jgi:excisionase family DNA binding protein
MTDNALGELLTPDEAAAELRASGEAVRALLRAGTLGGFRLSDGPRARYRIPEHELERFVAARQTRRSPGSSERKVTP